MDITKIAPYCSEEFEEEGRWYRLRLGQVLCFHSKLDFYV